MRNEVKPLNGDSNKYSKISVIINGTTVYSSGWEFIGSGSGTVNFNVNY